MNRRDFLAATAVAAVGMNVHHPAFDIESVPTEPTASPPPTPISPETFRQRIARAQELLSLQKLDFLFVTPGTTFHYFAGYNPGRSERLIALLIAAEGSATIVSPAFEKERILRRSVVTSIETWEEHEDPYALTGRVVRSLHGAQPTVGVEATVGYLEYLHLKRALPQAQFVDGSPVVDTLRMTKSPEELETIQKCIDITITAIAATHEQLKEGMAEQDVSRLLSGEMSKRGAPGGGLVQFGPSSAIPHGGPGSSRLARGTVVLIDAGCRVDGYTSDITRTIFWGAEPPTKFREVYNIVHEAQQSAAEMARPGIACQELDRTARRIIERAGYGTYFTHRLGHGMGMDGHEHPYLVEGNTQPLKPGYVFTIEPGIYLPGEFGVRIEDDFVVTQAGLRPLSPLTERL